MDQKGQAFSVFELMIAAIVAVAILFVLLPIISGGFSFNTTPKDAISNSLSAVKSGGQTTSQDFSIQPGQLISSTQFVEAGFDQRSLIFGVSDNKFPYDYAVESKTSSDSGLGFTIFRYEGSSAQTAKAVVICEQTGSSLQDVIDASVDNLSTDATYAVIAFDDDALCGEDDVQPCCAVVIQKA